MNTFAILFLSTMQQVAVRSNMILTQETVPAETTTSDGNLTDQLQGHAAEVSETLNQSEAVQQVSGGILEPIYQLGEFMTFSSFYWVAFAMMIAGVVCFAGQLVFAKFFLLFKASLNLREIISDFFCLLISAIGLVLVTQVATNHNTFTDNSMAVISATAVGGLLGLVFYWWGQKTEFQAARRIPKEEAA